MPASVSKLVVTFAVSAKYVNNATISIELAYKVYTACISAHTKTFHRNVNETNLMIVKQLAALLVAISSRKRSR